ncbi:probable carboxylesterase 18 [Miscanthus floridulus]|uniref:probable carboxylesterase 18 n=1 Tax=Miscanthus floridulus TaxID=154761 RepID=UPI0034590D26
MGCSTSRYRTPRRTPSLPWKVRVMLAALPVAYCLHGCIRRPVELFHDLLMKTGATPSSDASEVRSADITVDASRGLWIRVFSPSAAAISDDDAPLPVVVYFHGGGFMLGSPSSRPYDAFCRRLCHEIRAVIVSVNYRHAPQHRFPTAYDDGVAALRYLDETPLPLPTDLVPVPAVDFSSCFLVGDSSGANMVHHVAQRWASMSATLPPVRLRPAGAILIQPFFGGEERTEAELTLDKACRTLSVARADHFWREFLPEGATRDHPAARVCGEGVELADTFPPAMVVSGGFDLLKDWHAKYVETLRGKGKLVRVVDYPDAVHGFYVFPELADSGKLVDDMKLFVDYHRSNKASLV